MRSIGWVTLALCASAIAVGFFGGLWLAKVDHEPRQRCLYIANVPFGCVDIVE